MVLFNIRMLRTGDAYGRGDSLVAERPMIEFYDPRYSGKGFSSFGQFVTRYSAETLADFDGGRLCLNGSIPAWTVCETQMAQVTEIAKKLLDEKPTNQQRTEA